MTTTVTPKESRMVQKRPKLCGYHVVLGLAVALASTVMGCGFRSRPAAINPPDRAAQLLNLAPYRALTSHRRATVYEVAGKRRVQHGSGCASAPQAASTDYVGFRIHDMATVPLDYYDAGTVFLNGWRLQYNDGDHAVLGLGSAIYNVTEGRNGGQFELDWDAGG